MALKFEMRLDATGDFILFVVDDYELDLLFTKYGVVYITSINFI